MITLWILAPRCLNLARLEKQNNQNKVVKKVKNQKNQMFVVLVVDFVIFLQSVQNVEFNESRLGDLVLGPAYDFVFLVQSAYFLEHCWWLTEFYHQ